MRYLDLYWIVPKIPKITAMMCKKFARMGAHWYPRKSKICLSSAATCNRPGRGPGSGTGTGGDLDQAAPAVLKARSGRELPGIPWITGCSSWNARAMHCPSVIWDIWS